MWRLRQIYWIFVTNRERRLLYIRCNRAANVYGKQIVIHGALKFRAQTTASTDTATPATFTVDDAVKVHRTYTGATICFASFSNRPD